MIVCEHGMLKRSCPTCNLKLDMQKLQMSIEELIEKYKLQRQEHIIECSKGEVSRLKHEPVANKLTDVIEDLEEVMK